MKARALPVLTNTRFRCILGLNLKPFVEGFNE